MSTRHLVSVPALALLLAAIAGCGQRTPAPAAESPDAAPKAVPSGERVVNVYNWADYIDPEVIADFEQTSGIEVNYDTFDSQEMLETKLLATKSGYDVVVVASDKLARLGADRGVPQARLQPVAVEQEPRPGAAPGAGDV